jgi:hypothetical protein
MILQYQPMQWPSDKPVDWADSFDRESWVKELRDHIFDLFSVGHIMLDPAVKRKWPREQAMESLLANKRVIDEMLHLAGAPLEVWREMRVFLPLTKHEHIPEVAAMRSDPFQELPLGAWSAKERLKWLGYVDGQLEYLVAMLLLAHPEGTEQHRRARWAVIRLRVLFDKLRTALAVAPMAP